MDCKHEFNADVIGGPCIKCGIFPPQILAKNYQPESESPLEKAASDPDIESVKKFMKGRRLKKRRLDVGCGFPVLKWPDCVHTLPHPDVDCSTWGNINDWCRFNFGPGLSGLIEVMMNDHYDEYHSLRGYRSDINIEEAIIYSWNKTIEQLGYTRDLD